MVASTNANQLVLRLDSATGFATVGWATELPQGRFIHLELIGEAEDCTPIDNGNPMFELYQRACLRACGINQALIDKQQQYYRAKGCLRVPLDLHNRNGSSSADEFGCYRAAAMQSLFRLTGNFTAVWVVIQAATIVRLCSRQPPKPMETLEFQVWKHHILKQLAQTPGEIKTGNLLVQESGLWFCPDE
ncbi:hypothetical protein [Kaarinaea lacus]